MDKHNRYYRIISYTFLCIFVFIFFLAAHLYLLPSLQLAVFQSALEDPAGEEKGEASDDDLTDIRMRAEWLNRKIDRLASPGNAYLIVNTSDNTFRLYRRHQLVRSGLCSTGSFIHLEADSSQNWVFETPKGVLTVKNKIIDPVWHKPDWAFIEEGLEPPPPGHPSRYERGVLGDYALDLGNGYLIHGTLYQRFLGMSVTHGCIRLNDEDLKNIYYTLPIGSKVYIY